MAKSKGYLNFSWIVSVILAIIPITNIVLGIYLRLKKEKFLLAVLNLIIFPIFYVVDLISIVINGGLKYLI